METWCKSCKGPSSDKEKEETQEMARWPLVRTS